MKTRRMYLAHNTLAVTTTSGLNTGGTTREHLATAVSKTAHDQFQGRVILTDVGLIAPYTIPLPRKIQYECVILRNEMYSSRAAKPPYQNMFYVLPFITPHIPCKHLFYGFTTVKLKQGQSLIEN